MQNSLPKLRQTSPISKKPGFLSERLKILTSSNYHRVWFFLLKLCTRFLLSNVYKMVCRIFFILFRSKVSSKASPVALALEVGDALVEWVLKVPTPISVNLNGLMWPSRAEPDYLLSSTLVHAVRTHQELLQHILSSTKPKNSRTGGFSPCLHDLLNLLKWRVLIFSSCHETYIKIL